MARPGNGKAATAVVQGAGRAGRVLIGEEVIGRTGAARILGISGAAAQLRATAKKLARYDSTVLLEGETGAGKEVLARAIHEESGRGDGPFVAVNVAALPEQLLESELFGYAPGAFTGASREGRLGKFRLAHGGTIFLDEIGDMPLVLQVKLLRVLQERVVDPIGAAQPVPVDIRVIAATNRDLGQMVRQGKFREDLYHRLAVVRIRVPPLRERREDVRTLAEDFLGQLVRRYGEPRGFEAGAFSVLEAYDWPGNVRELQNVVEHLYVMADGPVIMRDQVERVLAERGGCGAPAADGEPEQDRGLSEELERQEREILIRALQEAGGNKRAAARALGLSHQTFYNRLYKYGLL